MDPRILQMDTNTRFFTTASGQRFAYRPGAFQALRAPGDVAVRSGEFGGMSTTTWLAIGAVGVVGVMLLAKKKRRR